MNYSSQQKNKKYVDYEDFARHKLVIPASIANDRVHIDLGIFQNRLEEKCLIDYLKRDMTFSEQIILALLLGSPVNDIAVISSRQNIIKHVRSLNLNKDFMDWICFRKGEDVFINFIFSENTQVEEEHFIDILNTIKNFSSKIIYLYNYLEDKNLLNLFSNKIKQIERFRNVLLYGNNVLIEIVKQLNEEEFNSNVSNYMIPQMRKLIDKLIQFKKVWRELWLEYRIITFYFRFVLNTKSLSLTRLLSRTQQPYPFFSIRGMKNFYRDKPVDGSFIFRANDKAKKIQVFTKEEDFKYKDSLRNMLLNIYLSQTFGISFSEECIMTPFNAIFTNIKKINK